MKKVLILLITLSVFSSCQQRLTRPLKGNYPSDYTITIDKPSDQVWDDMFEYCSKKGISLKTLDKKSGIIISEPYRIRTFTFENEDGTPEIVSADVIVGCETIGPFKKDCMPPFSIWTNIIFRVKEEDNKTLFTITLSDITAWYSEYHCLKDIKSTGFFEKQLIAQIQ